MSFVLLIFIITTAIYYPKCISIKSKNDNMKLNCYITVQVKFILINMYRV